MPLPPVQPLPPPPPPPPITIPVYFPQLTPVPFNGPVPQSIVPPQPQPLQHHAGFPLPPLQPFQPTNVAPPGYPFQLPQQPFQLPRIY